jgi:hypothetical protein
MFDFWTLKTQTTMPINPLRSPLLLVVGTYCTMLLRLLGSVIIFICKTCVCVSTFIVLNLAAVEYNLRSSPRRNVC